MGNKIAHSIISLLLTGMLFGQYESVQKRYEEGAKNYRYVRDKRYNGPKNWNSGTPATMKDKDLLIIDPYEQISPGDLEERLNETRNNQIDKGSGGDLKKDPKTQLPEPIQLPEIDPPNIDPPNLPDIDPPTFSENFWKTLAIVILAGLFIFLVYWLFRNYKVPARKVEADFAEAEWNPEVITKSDLELKLEAALKDENYRECVRIYFTFILKELIQKKYIHWKKEKTNHEYSIEIGNKPNAYLFRECVRIYDLIWYGEYQIDRKVFEAIEPTMKHTLQQFEKAK